MFFAKKLVPALLAVGVSVTFTACEEGNYAAKPNPLTTVTATSDNVAEVLTGIYDDNKSTVYVKVDKPFRSQEDAAVAQLMLKKRKWEEKNPNKDVIAMTVITGDAGGYGHPVVVGLLIHYKQR